MAKMFDTTRLRREEWGPNDLTLFAEEIISFLESVNENGLGPLIIQSNGTEPPLSIRSPYNGGAPAPIQYIHGGTQWNIPAIPGAFDPVLIPDPIVPQIPGLPIYEPIDTGGGGGGTSPPSLPDRDESGDTLPDPPQDDPPSLPYPAFCRIVSGTGKNYVVDIWLADPEEMTASPWARFPAYCPQIDEDDEIPVDTVLPCVVFTIVSSGVSVAKVYIQPAVFLEE